LRTDSRIPARLKIKSLKALERKLQIRVC
jgi:hypothetical protein